MDGIHRGQTYPPGVGESGGAQAVALTLSGDRIQLENVRLLGHQDTLYAKRPAPQAPARQLIRHSLIAGDVDFIFGNAVLVMSPEHYKIFKDGGWSRRQIEDALYEALKRPGKDLVWGAQDVAEWTDGAYTGAVSVAMLPVLAILVFAGTAMMQRDSDE